MAASGTAKLESHRSITECSSVCFHVVNQLSSYVSCTILNCSQVIKCEKFSDFLPFNNKGATTPSSYSQSLDDRKLLYELLDIVWTAHWPQQERIRAAVESQHCHGKDNLFSPVLQLGSLHY
ncbi:hypothetical protein OUZ56_008155 [Daphnia magna]|uniref:Uncharacterized protein n=1 Tax=Daphnia magna TaxID=35525 RepID=A0ABR0AC98_9CRUS|nr:hypothetical protein OUZ56_008155 [Daphnia magna]